MLLYYNNKIITYFSGTSALLWKGARETNKVDVSVHAKLDLIKYLLLAEKLK